MKRFTTVLALAASAVVFAVPAGHAATNQGPPSVIVSAKDASVLPVGARFVAEMAPGLRMYTLRVPEGKTAAEYARTLGDSHPDIHGAQPNTRLKIDALASPCADAPSVNGAQSLAGTVGALSVPAPGPTDPVAVLDTGVSPATPELAGRVLTGTWAVNGSSDTTDVDGHGTEVAAVVAAAPGRFQGISPTTPILPIKIYNNNSTTTVDWVVKGIEAAVKAKAPIINLSSSNPASDVSSGDASVLQLAINAAFAKGTIVIVSAGNEGKGDRVIPGSLEHVITVGSATPEGTRDAFSNFGSWIDIVSPGANMILPAPPNVCSTGYGTANGTSFSAPAVAGAAALIKSLRPKLDTQQLYDLLRMETAKELYTPGRDNDSGFGLLSVADGITAPTPSRQSTELDDDVFWIKQDRKKHPTYLRTTRSRKFKKTASVQAGKDPADLYPVRLNKGWLLRASAKTSKTSGLLDVAIWNTNMGSFDLSRNKTTALLKDTEGVTNTPNISYRVKRTGTYYVSVEAPDAPDTATGETQATVPIDAFTKYTLNLSKSRPKSRCRTVKKKRKGKTVKVRVCPKKKKK